MNVNETRSNKGYIIAQVWKNVSMWGYTWLIFQDEVISKISTCFSFWVILKAPNIIQVTTDALKCNFRHSSCMYNQKKLHSVHFLHYEREHVDWKEVWKMTLVCLLPPATTTTFFKCDQKKNLRKNTILLLF